MSIIWQQLSKIKDNPYIYLGAASLPLLKAFMDGYSLRHDEVSADIHGGEYDEFIWYIYKHYKVDYQMTSKSWIELIEADSKDPTRAFEKFFEILADYLSITTLFEDGTSHL